MQKSCSEQPIPFISHGWLIQSYASALQRTLFWFGLSVGHLAVLCNAPLCVSAWIYYIIDFKLQAAFSVCSFLKTKHCNFINNTQIRLYVCVHMKYQWQKLPWRFLLECSEFCIDIANCATILSVSLTESY